ncbi:short-chain dehydrogenase [Leptodontidium sp. 2 PMI_412]|nr:short-chain dehydrogenase [Leptodontidium sp. 2 PMI_412]
MSVRRSTIFPNKPMLTEKNLSDQQGKVFLVTGGSGGLGKELISILYQHNARVYVAARSQAKTDEIIRDIETSYPNSSGALIFLRLVLDDLTTIKRSAEEFLGKESRLDVLWNNAGVMVPPQGSKTVQGYELQLGINNLGHFLFTYFLRPILAATARTAPRNSVRVIWVSSSAADNAPHPAIDFTNMDYHREEGIWSKYSRSKAGNVLHSAEFARRTADESIISLVGNFVTNLQQDMPKMQLAMFRLITHHPKKGAYTELFAGLSPTITEQNNAAFDFAQPSLAYGIG